MKNSSVTIEQLKSQINDLERDNSDLTAENMKWQDKYGNLQEKYFKLLKVSQENK